MDSIEPDFIPESYSYDELTAKDSTIAENFPGIAGA
jgi:hypothetical protein